MSNHSPIPSPPWELVQQWSDIKPMEDAVVQNWVKIATAATRWGADQELEACCEWLDQNTGRWDLLAELRAARRPKPPSLAKRALHILGTHGDLSCAEHDTIRRALEALDD